MLSIFVFLAVQCGPWFRSCCAFNPQIPASRRNGSVKLLWKKKSESCLFDANPTSRDDYSTDKHHDEPAREASRNEEGIKSYWFLGIPPSLSVILAFVTYDDTRSSFHNFVQTFSPGTWNPVDGGKLASEVLTPALNGPLLSSITLLFATLTAMTVSSLYDRQLRIRNSLAREVEDLRNLSILVATSLPAEPYRSEVSKHVSRYVEQFRRDIRDGELTKPTRQEGIDQILVLLNQNIMCTGGNDTTPIPDVIAGQVYDCVIRINTERCNTITALSTTFPVPHYVILSVLGLSFCLVFFMLTDQELLQFLGQFQLKLIWSLLVLVLSLVATIIYDLATPFTGSYKIMSVTEDDLEAARDYMRDPLILENIFLSDSER